MTLAGAGLVLTVALAGPSTPHTFHLSGCGVMKLVFIFAPIDFSLLPTLPLGAPVWATGCADLVRCIGYYCYGLVDTVQYRVFVG